MVKSGAPSGAGEHADGASGVRQVRGTGTADPLPGRDRSRGSGPGGAPGSGSSEA